MLLLLLKVAPRVNKPVVEFTAIGFKALQRAILETERRFCGNQTKELNHNSVLLNDGNTLLSDDEAKMLVILRINVHFMEFMRDHCGHVVANQPWRLTIVE